MCDILSFERFLALLLDKKDQISIKEMRVIRDKVEKKIPHLVIDLSAPSVVIAMERYSEIFAKNKGIVRRAEKSKPYYDGDYLDNVFLHRIPKKVKSEVLHTLEAA